MVTSKSDHTWMKVTIIFVTELIDSNFDQMDWAPYANQNKTLNLQCCKLRHNTFW
jgi:hypothetical protein